MDGVGRELQPPEKLIVRNAHQVWFVVHLVPLHVEDPSQVKRLRIVMLPELPFTRPIIRACDRQPRLTAGDLRANLNAELAHLAKGVVHADVIAAARPHIHGFVAIAEIGPVNIGGAQRTGTQRSLSHDEGSLVSYAITGGRVVVTGLDVACRSEHARPVDAGVTPPILGVAVGEKVAGVVGQDFRRRANAVRREGEDGGGSGGRHGDDCANQPQPFHPI